MRAVRDYEDLHELEKPRLRPEALALIALDLVERLAKRHAAALELDVHQRQAVHEDGHIVAVPVRAPVGLVLVHDLQAVPVDVVAVEEHDVSERAVGEREVDHGVLLDAARFLDDALRLVGDDLAEEALPVLVGELEAVEQLDLTAQVGDEVGLAPGRQALVALTAELGHKLFLELRLGLIGGRGVRRFRRLGANRGLGALEQHRVGRRGRTADGIHYRHEAATSLRGKSSRWSR